MEVYSQDGVTIVSSHLPTQYMRVWQREILEYEGRGWRLVDGQAFYALGEWWVWMRKGV